jgi:hypothetical protein
LTSKAFAAATTVTVGLSWALQVGALSVPGKYAEKLADVKTTNAKEHAALMGNPSSGRLLRDFLAAECAHLATARSLDKSVLVFQRIAQRSYRPRFPFGLSTLKS